ncbi:hypothetical protein [Methanosarcina barkeri]|nr:hypothetical protein [Methanosarcina barkeri]
MEKEYNQLLGYTIDKLLQTFNYNRKPIMSRFHFFKLMNLLDQRLRKQNIDIKLPGYWYKYGFYSEERFFDSVLVNSFTENYVIDDNIYPPTIKTDYNGKVSIKEAEIISETIRYLYDQYGGKREYGDLIKEESYRLYSPYRFNTIFQEYIYITDVNSTHVSEKLKDNINSELDKLLLEFPIKSFPELASIHFEWDDTTRLVLDCAPDEIKLSLTKHLRDEFWEIYSKRIRIEHNQNIPDYAKRKWKLSYESELAEANKTIENIRCKVLSNYYNPSEENKEFVKKLMEDIYNIPSEGA